MVIEVRILLDIALILIFAKIFGEIAERIKLDPLIGQIFAGLLLGPILLWVQPTQLLEFLSFLGIIFLMFLMGLSTRFDEVKKDLYTGSALAVSGAALSFIAGFIIGELVFNSFNIGLFLGIAIMSTSTAIPIKSLIDMGELKSRIGRMIVVTAMADDIISMLGVSFLTTYFTIGIVQLWQTVALFFTIIGFVLIILTFGSKISNGVLSVFQRMRDENILVTFPIAIVFILAFLSQRVGVAAVTGAFLAGMAMSKSVFNDPIISPKVRTIGYGIFIPIFFAYSAIIIDMSKLLSYWWFILILLAAGITAKMVGCGGLSRLFGFKGREQGIMAIGMIPRGEYGIIVSQLAFGLGIITGELYAAAIGFVIVTIILTPILMRLFVHSQTKYMKVK
ncbi:MAG: cation:proton antiporter [Candidatus Aenigmarchaeota archaeon]|nr:cation:proton antiporter [Candidatus Aenigmarchaeota archaeon]